MNKLNRFKKILTLFFGNKYYLLFIVILIIFFTSLFESFSVSLIYPFMQLVSDQNYLNDNEYIKLLHLYTGSIPYYDFVLLFGVTIISSIIFISVITFICRWIIFKFTWSCFSIVQKELMRSYLANNYEYFLSRDMSELSKNLLTEVGIAVNGFLYPFVDGLSKLVSVILLISLMAFFDPHKTLAITLIVIFIYSFLSLFSGKLTKKFGSQRLLVHEDLYKSTIETFGVFKLIKAKSLENVFINNFNKPANQYAKLNLWVSLLSIFPKYILETTFVCSAIVFILYELKVNGDVVESLPTISLFAFSAIKILPYLQQVYSNFIKCIYNWPAVIKLEGDCFNNLIDLKLSNNSNSNSYSNHIFNNSLSFQNITYSFAHDTSVLKNINLNVEKNTFNIICGKTGCGKSTLIDIMIGLLTPSSGNIFADEVKLSTNDFINLRSRIGYAPQHTVLLDSSIVENIAFGVAADKIDNSKINEVAKLTQVSHLLSTDLDIGEGGSKLSGGEKQRIGIARALYDDPEILILDESTSAIDPETEKKLLNDLRSLSHLTIIMVTHRIESLNPDDLIYFMENGKIDSFGTYSDLLQNCSSFKALCGRL